MVGFSEAFRDALILGKVCVVLYKYADTVSGYWDIFIPATCILIFVWFDGSMA